MIRVLVLHPGTQHAFRLATELHRLGRLRKFHTGFAATGDGIWATLIGYLPIALKRLIMNRLVEELPAELVTNHLSIELVWQARQMKYGPGQLLIHWRNEIFQRQIANKDLADADIIIGFDTSSWIINRRCRELGKPVFLVRSTIHPNEAIKINEKLVREFPDWAHTYERREQVVQAADGRLGEDGECQESSEQVGHTHGGIP